jgi:hypothetical protein
MCDTHRRTYHQTGGFREVSVSTTKGYDSPRYILFPTILRLYPSLTECVEGKLTTKKKFHP